MSYYYNVFVQSKHLEAQPTPEKVKMYNGYVDPTKVLGGYHCKKRVYEFTVMFTFFREYKNNDKINANPSCGGWQLFFVTDEQF